MISAKSSRIIRLIMALTMAVLVGALLTSCGASRHYAKTETGKLSGDLELRWAKPDRFLFIPSETRPLTFVRSEESGGGTIIPGTMYTDGGSIPRPLRALRNYSPWGYASAFVVHDWLFHMQDCELPGYEDYSLKEAAVVMSEVMKTMMEDPSFDYGDKQTLYLMYLAVQTTPAKSAWDDKRCNQLPVGGDEIRWDAVIQISFN